MERCNRPRSILSKGCYVCTAFSDDVNGVVGRRRIGDGEVGGVGNCVRVCVGTGAGVRDVGA